MVYDGFLPDAAGYDFGEGYVAPLLKLVQSVAKLVQVSDVLEQNQGKVSDILKQF